MNPQRRLILSGLVFASPLLAMAHPESEDGAQYVTRKLSIGGRVLTGLTLDLDALREFPLQGPSDIPIRGRNGELLRTLFAYSGVRLTDILDKSVLVKGEHDDLKKTIIVATASDDYKALFSWNELYNTSVGEGVLVLYEKSGQPLDDNEGKIALISINDRHTGPRHVRWLSDIQVRMIA